MDATEQVLASRKVFLERQQARPFKIYSSEAVRTCVIFKMIHTSFDSNGCTVTVRPIYISLQLNSQAHRKLVELQSAVFLCNIVQLANHMCNIWAGFITFKSHVKMYEASFFCLGVEQIVEYLTTLTMVAVHWATGLTFEVSCTGILQLAISNASIVTSC